jgi:hypothetical protein
MKYAKFNPQIERRETWKELVDRNKGMHLKKFPELSEEIENAYRFVYDKKALPSMRSMQFAGKPIEISPNRVYNCAYLPIDDWRAFGETMFLLLGGTYEHPKNSNISSSVLNSFLINDFLSFKPYSDNDNFLDIARLRKYTLNSILPVKYNKLKGYSFAREYKKSIRLCFR